LLIVQHAAGQAAFTSGVSGVVDVPIGAAGPESCLVACVSAVGSSGTPSVAGIETGSSAENWAEGVEQDDTSNTAATAIWTDEATPGGGTLVAVTCAFGATATPANSCVVFVDVFEVSGAALSSAVDQVSIGAAGQDSEAWSSGATPVTAQASELAIGAMTITPLSGALTITGPASPWVNEAPLSGTVEFGGSSFNCYAACGYQPLAAKQAVTYAGTASESGLWNAVVLTLKAAPSGTVTVAPGDPGGIGVRPGELFQSHGRRRRRRF
jgi:hypothetical protein